MTTPLWLGLLTLLISLVGAFSGIAQFLLAREKLRFELYQKRFNIYHQILGIIFDCLEKGTENIEYFDQVKLIKVFSEGRFLFGAEVFSEIKSAERSILYIAGMKHLSREGDLTEKQALKQRSEFSNLQRIVSSFPDLVVPYIKFEGKRHLKLL